MPSNPRTADQVVAQATGGTHLGDVVFLRLWQATTPRSQVGSVAASNGFPEDLLPDGLSAESAFLQAMRTTKLPEGWLLRHVAKTADEHVWDAVYERRDEAKQALEYPAGDRIRLTFDRKANRLSCSQPNHQVAVTIQRAIASMTDAVTTRMLRRMANGVCKSHDGIEIGTEWFVPARHSELMRAMRGLVNSLGDSRVWLLPVFDSDDSRDTLNQAVQTSIENDLQTLQKEIEDFTKDTRDFALERRLATFDEIRTKANLYKDILSVAQDDLLAKIGKMEEKVREMLGVK